jgi:O-antigen/teichoic acid export membrane protein
MNPRYRELIKHSGIYGIGQLLGRLTSIVMLPVHTRYLTPADYGTIAILDLTSSLLGILIAGGMAPALVRYHQDSATAHAESAVWWTGLTVVAGLTAVIILPALLFRQGLANLTLGPQEPSGAFFFGLVLWTLWFSVLSQIATAYFRLRMWSWLNVGLALVSLFFNVALNLYLLVARGWGITGILVGNLVTLVIFSILRLAIVSRSSGPFRFEFPLARKLLRFGTPIVATLLLATVMHQADRYLLRRFVDLDTVGVYSLAYQMGQGINSLFLIPFSAVWSVTMYDIAKQADAREAFARIFEYFVYGVLLLMLGVSLFVGPLLKVVATDAYAGAAALLPIVCLSLVFFSADEHFRVPALLAKRTLSLVPANALGAAANVLLNLLLIPIYGVVAAAWVSVATYAIFAGVNLLQARRIDRYDYPLRRCAAILVAMVLSVMVSRRLEAAFHNIAWSLAVPLMIWCGWAAGLTYPFLKQYRRMHVAEAGL